MFEVENIPVEESIESGIERRVISVDETSKKVREDVQLLPSYNLSSK